MKLILKIFIFIILVSGSVLFVLFRPTYKSELKYQGEKIRIERDEFNIPTIKTQSRKSFLYALGYTVAEDRLFQISFKKLVVNGRISQFLGQKALNMDKSMRELGLKHWGAKIAAKLKRENKTSFEILSAFTRGINDCAKDLIILPIDFHLIGLNWETYTLSDMFAISKLLEWTLSTTLKDEYSRSVLLKYFSKEEVEKRWPHQHEQWIDADNQKVIASQKQIDSRLNNKKVLKNKFKPVVVEEMVKLGMNQYIDSQKGSNNWVISGKHTESGQPIAAYDPHLDNHIPAEWYQFKAQYKENGKKYSMALICPPGLPFYLGKTDYFTVSATVLYRDSQDLYQQKIEGKKYMVDGKWFQLKQRNQKIKIKKDGQMLQENYVVYETYRGPIIHHIYHLFGEYHFDQNYSVAWTGFNNQYSSILASIFLIETKDFQTLVSKFKNQIYYMPSFNILYSTKDGHIGYQQLGLSPIRNNAHEGAYIKDGTVSDYDWKGFVPPLDRVSIQDPKKGYIVTANNKPAESSYYGGIFETVIYTARANRIDQLIRKKIDKGKKISMDYVKQMQLDTVDSYCLHVLPSLLKSSSIKQYLGSFDCNFSRNSYQASIYEILLFEISELEKLSSGQLLEYGGHPYNQHIYKYILSGKNAESIQKAFKKSKKRLSQFFKTDEIQKWIWSQIHTDTINHLPFSGSDFLKKFYGRSFPGQGNINTINVGMMKKISSGKFETTHRANFRAVMSFKEQSQWIIDTGSSEKVFSKHYDDQYELFKESLMIPMTLPDQQAKRKQYDNEL